MNIFNFLGANALMIGFFVFDIILILCAIGISIWFYVKYLKQNKNKIQQEQNKNIEKIDDDTYIIETNEDFDEEQSDVVKKQKTTIYILLFFKCFDTIILYSKIEEISYEKQINYFCSINFKFIYDSKQSS